jgi:hypothetical protein
MFVRYRLTPHFSGEKLSLPICCCVKINSVVASDSYRFNYVGPLSLPLGIAFVTSEPFVLPMAIPLRRKLLP